MSKSMYSHEQVIQAGQFTPEDMKAILQRRRDPIACLFAHSGAIGHNYLLPRRSRGALQSHPLA